MSERTRAARSAIFYYHSVGGPPPQTLPLEIFRQHLDAIRRHGRPCVPVSELAGRGDHDGCIALAFDDGLLDNYTNVLPMLLEYGYRATFYVVPGYDRVTRYVHPGTGRWSDTARQGYTVPFASMQASQRRELVALGMEIGSHSCTHRMLTRIAPAEVAVEVRRSKAILEDELGAAVSSFCYPNGRFNPRIIREVREAGYRTACSTLPGYFHRDWSPYRLHRFLAEDPAHVEHVLLGRAFAAGQIARQVARLAGLGGRTVSRQSSAAR